MVGHMAGHMTGSRLRTYDVIGDIIITSSIAPLLRNIASPLRDRLYLAWPIGFVLCLFGIPTEPINSFGIGMEGSHVLTLCPITLFGHLYSHLIKVYKNGVFTYRTPVNRSCLFLTTIVGLVSTLA